MDHRKFLSLLLAGAVACSLAGCRQEVADPYAAYEDYDELSQQIYDDVLGDFYTLYRQALSESNVSRRQALMAVAEAKLLATGVMLPLSSKGGNYAISRVAPYTAATTLWGNDQDRFHNILVTTAPISAAHRDELKALWASLKGTGTWEAEAKKFLTERGYTLKDSYAMSYTEDPQTWDILATSMSADAEAIVNTYDGLFEYDSENVLRPALAESYEVSEDGTVYTFKIRRGAVWVDSQGRVVDEVTADDFVAGMQHMMDAMGGLEYLVRDVIVGADDYIQGSTTDFSDVGVKALDEYTLEYTLTAPTSYFMTMLGYNVFAPMSRAFYKSQGGKFGAAYDSTAAGYTYGRTPENIAYCGPYRVTNATAQNTIVFRANEAYWNKDNINIKTITWLYNDGTDAMKSYTDAKTGVIDGTNLNAAAVEAARADGLFDEFGYVSSNNATSYMAFVNLRRGVLANFNDDSAVRSPKTEEERLRTNGAMQNVHFRRALAMAVDRGAYNAQTVGEALKLTSLRNTFTPGNFISLEEAVTISIGGTEKTYPAGTFYGEIVQDQLTADGIPITVWDKNAEGGIGSSDGFDGWYHPEAAKAELASAVEELKAAGVEVSPADPIYLDLPCWTTNEQYANRANAYKQSVESVLGGCVVINLVPCATSDEWYDAGYWPATGGEMNYDVCDMSGWGPDYGDPQTYLDTMLPQYAGYMTKAIGIF